MLITARDIVARLGEITDERIREELAGNLCRCTGYVGIVNALRAVANGKLAGTAASTAAVGIATAAVIATTTGCGVANRRGEFDDTDTRWAIDADGTHRGECRARCCMGCAGGPSAHRCLCAWAEITEVDGEQLVGTVRVALGPIKAAFAGRGTLTRNDATREGSIIGQSCGRWIRVARSWRGTVCGSAGTNGREHDIGRHVELAAFGDAGAVQSLGSGPRCGTADRRELRAQPGGVAYERGTSCRASTRSVGAAMVDDQNATDWSLTEAEHDILDRGTMCADRTVRGGCCIVLAGGGRTMRLCAGWCWRGNDAEHHRSSAGSAGLGPDGVGC